MLIKSVELVLCYCSCPKECDPVPGGGLDAGWQCVGNGTWGSNDPQFDGIELDTLQISSFYLKLKKK